MPDEPVAPVLLTARREWWHQVRSADVHGVGLMPSPLERALVEHFHVVEQAIRADERERASRDPQAAGRAAFDRVVTRPGADGWPDDEPDLELAWANLWNAHNKGERCIECSNAVDAAYAAVRAGESPAPGVPFTTFLGLTPNQWIALKANVESRAPELMPPAPGEAQ